MTPSRSKITASTEPVHISASIDATADTRHQPRRRRGPINGRKASGSDCPVMTRDITWCRRTVVTEPRVEAELAGDPQVGSWRCSMMEVLGRGFLSRVGTVRGGRRGPASNSCSANRTFHLRTPGRRSCWRLTIRAVSASSVAGVLKPQRAHVTCRFAPTFRTFAVWRREGDSVRPARNRTPRSARDRSLTTKPYGSRLPLVGPSSPNPAWRLDNSADLSRIKERPPARAAIRCATTRPHLPVLRAAGRTA